MTQIDHAVAIMAVAVATFVLVRRAWRAFRAFRESNRCAAVCGCDARDPS